MIGELITLDCGCRVSDLRLASSHTCGAVYVKASGRIVCPDCDAYYDTAIGHRCPPGLRAQRIAFLEKMRETTKADLLSKFENEDWHGTADAAMDLRDVDSELEGLRYGE